MRMKFFVGRTALEALPEHGPDILAAVPLTGGAHFPEILGRLPLEIRATGHEITAVEERLAFRQRGQDRLQALVGEQLGFHPQRAHAARLPAARLGRHWISPGVRAVAAGHSVAFLTAAAICLCAVACSLSIRDADAASTIPGRGGQEGREPRPASAEAA